MTDSYGRNDDDSETDEDENGGDEDSDSDSDNGETRGRNLSKASDNNFEGCYDHDVGDDRGSSDDESKLAGSDGGRGGSDGRGRNQGSSSR